MAASQVRRSAWRAHDARMQAAFSGSRMMHGGYTEHDAIEGELVTRIESLVDTLIPPEHGWPDAHELGVVDVLARYLVPSSAPVSFYPHLTVADLVAILDEIGDLSNDAQSRIAAVAAYEQHDPKRFALLRDFIYYVFYGCSSVVTEINRRTRYGAAYLGGGQPEGYDASLEDWGDRAMTTKGAFFTTDSVVRVLEGQR